MVMKDLLPRAAAASCTVDAAAPAVLPENAAELDENGAHGAAAWPVLRLRKRNISLGGRFKKNPIIMLVWHKDRFFQKQTRTVAGQLHSLLDA